MALGRTRTSPPQVLWLLLVAALAYAGWRTSPADAASRAGECGSIDTEACDARYDPVCASWDTGIRCVRAPCPAAEPRLYTNACLACRDDRVNGFQHGECAERPEPEMGERRRVKLDGLVGRLTQKDRGAVVDVDLHVSEPIAVMRAWIWIEGDASPGSAESLDPSEGVVPMPVTFQVALQDSFDRPVFDITSPVARLGPFDGRFKAEGVLGLMSARLGRANWSGLSDGRIQLELAFTRSCPDAGCRYLDDAVLTIRRAELVVDAVPESELPQRDDPSP